MSYSLNEIEGMCKRAARGAGMHWGLAEEAGKAARWLSAHNFQGIEKFVGALIRNDAKAYNELAPVSLKDIWRAVSEDLCPLITGAALCDCAADVAGGRVLEIGAIAHPLLLVPFGAAAAKLTDTTVKLSWPGVEIIVATNAIHVTGAPSTLYINRVDGIRCQRVETAPSDIVEQEARREIDTETWNQLNAFAQRTYAPATEASRLAGAGAGLTDTD